MTNLLSGGGGAIPPLATVQVHVEVDGMPLSPLVGSSLMTVEVDSTMHMPSQAKLVFHGSPSEVLETAGMLLASPLSVHYQADEESDRTDVFKGEITALEGTVSGGVALTVVRAMDRSHRLMRGTKTKAYQMMTASAIVEEMIGEIGLTPMSDPTTTVYPVLAQGNVSDWVFIQQLAALSNRVAYTDGVGGFKFVAPPTTDMALPGWTPGVPLLPGQLAFGQNLTNVRVVVSGAEQVASVMARGWDPSEKRAVVGRAEPSGTMVDSSDTGAEPVPVATIFGGKTFNVSAIPFSKQAEAETFAASVATNIANSLVEVEGEVTPGNPDLVAGKAVSIGNAGDPFDGKYVVTAARHVFGGGAGYYSTWITVSGQQDRSLLGLASGGAAPGWTRPAIPGIVTALVSSVKDPEKKGRVQLSFPWLDDTYVSDWARVLQVGAGAGWGNIFMPETNAEVLVAFDNGNIDHPYVIGGLYNGVDRITPQTNTPLVDDATGAIDQRLIQSRLKHMVYFCDSAEKNPGITIQTGTGNAKMQLDETDGSVKITINSKGDIEITGTQNITVTATQNLQLEGKQQLSLKSPQIQISADKALQVSSNGTAQINATGTMQIKGSETSINS